MHDTQLKQIPEDLLVARLDNPYKSLIVVDADGIVRFMSSSNEGVYPVPVYEAIGKHIRDVSPHTRLPCIIELDDLRLANSGGFTAGHPSGETAGPLKML